MWVSVEAFFEAKIERGQNKAQQVPATLSHCILAVTKKGKDVRDAWNICRASLTKHGYLKPPYRRSGKLDTVRQTQKGTRRTMKHAMERGAPNKFRDFSRLFRKIEPTV